MRTLLLHILAASALVSSAQSVRPQPAEASSRPRLGLALGGGGALGLTETGVLRWMEENHIPVDVLAGTSMGCMLSAFYATGRTPDEMRDLTNGDVFKRTFRIDTDFRSLSFRRRQDERRVPGSLTVGLKHGVSLRSGVLTDTDFNAYLNEQFLRYGGDRDFNSLPIPLRCVATDIDKGEKHIFRDGSIAEVVRASLSIPGVFPPLRKDDHLYVDGAILENLPTGTMKAELVPDVIVAISIPLAPQSKDERASIFGVLTRSFSVASWSNEQQSRKLADVLIEPDVNGLTTGDYVESEELARRGYAAAEKQRPALLKYRVSDAEWQTYLAAKASRIPPPPGIIRSVAVTAPTPRLQRSIQAAVTELQGQPLKAETINHELEEIRSDRRFIATYNVNNPSAPAGADLSIKVQDKTTGPPFLYVGTNIIAQNGQRARATLAGALVYQDLGGYRSELRTGFAVGFMTDADIEYYRRLTSGGLFVAPRLQILRTPVFIYNGAQRIAAERNHQKAGGGIDVGYGFHRSSELRLGWEEFVHRWSTTTGSDAQPDFSGTAQKVRMRYSLLKEDRALIPRRGLDADLDAGYLYNATHSVNAPRLQARFNYFAPFKGNTLALGAEGGTYLHRNVADPFRFELGGPLRLSASVIGEYRGTDYWLVRPMYLRRIATLPQPLGQSFYIMAAYEAGQMRSNTGSDITRQDGLFGFVAETPLGVVSVGSAFGDEGHRKVVFTLGHFF